jgi:NADP-dependent 3-hydroxy acid dehydrogenase YdfG
MLAQSLRLPRSHDLGDIKMNFTKNGIAVVIGGTSGMGFETAKQLVVKEIHGLMMVRSLVAIH